MSEHTTFWMGTKPADFCLQMQQSKESNESQMEAIIQKRKEAKKYFKTLSTTLKLVEQNITKLDKENERHLSGMMSHLELSKSNTPKDETAKSFARKVKESSDILKQELVNVQQLDDNYLTGLKKTKICVKFKDEDGDVIPTRSTLFEDGLNPRYSFDEFPMVPVASFILISGLNESLAEERALLPEPKAAKIPRLDGAANDSFDITEAVIAMTFFQYPSEIGTVYIKPDINFYQPFLEEFGQFCLSSTPFGGEIDKVFNC